MYETGKRQAHVHMVEKGPGEKDKGEYGRPEEEMGGGERVRREGV